MESGNKQPFMSGFFHLFPRLIQLGMVVHIFNLSTQGGRGRRISKFKANLVYTAGSRQPGIYRDTLTPNNKDSLSEPLYFVAKWFAGAWTYHMLFIIYTNAAHLCIYFSWLTFGDMNNDALNICVQMLYGYVFSWAYTTGVLLSRTAGSPCLLFASEELPKY